MTEEMNRINFRTKNRNIKRNDNQKNIINNFLIKKIIYNLLCYSL